MDKPGTRRQFLMASATTLGSAWAALHWPSILAAQTHAQQAAAAGGSKFEFLSPQDAIEVEAVAAQIIPSDDSPGAREAHVVYFIDRALTTFDRDKQSSYAQGLKELQAKTQSLFPGKNRFSDLTSEQQMQLLAAIQQTDFFELVRMHTVMGFLSKPEYGGNHDEAGWKLIGFEDKMSNHPPFGYYDRDYNKEH